MKRISVDAYQALREALPVITWNKRPFETLLRTALRDNAELLVGLNFGETKREVADALVQRLIEHESRYQEVTLRLMLEVASLSRFPNLEQLKDKVDREHRLGEARVAVDHLKTIMQQYAGDIEESERRAAAHEANAAQAAATRRFNDDLAALLARFLELQRETDAHVRGYALESLLADLFLTYDLEPRMAYVLELEQIDGSFTLETDDYILEARWRSGAADRGDGDVFAAKVGSKGKNALGLFVSINGFKSTFLERFKESTPFITMDGGDLFAVLDNRVRLDDLLRAKKRHANETGSCHLPASVFISEDS